MSVGNCFVRTRINYVDVLRYRMNQVLCYLNGSTVCLSVQKHFNCVNKISATNSIPEEIKSRLRSGNACCHSVQNLLSSRLLSKNLKIKIYRTIILYVILYGCETWSLTLREERKLRVFEKMVLRRIFGPRRTR